MRYTAIAALAFLLGTAGPSQASPTPATAALPIATISVGLKDDEPADQSFGDQVSTQCFYWTQCCGEVDCEASPPPGDNDDNTVMDE